MTLFIKHDEQHVQVVASMSRDMPPVALKDDEIRCRLLDKNAC
jgi:hypothetical protein